MNVEQATPIDIAARLAVLAARHNGEMLISPLRKSELGRHFAVAVGSEILGVGGDREAREAVINALWTIPQGCARPLYVRVFDNEDDFADACGPGWQSVAGSGQMRAA